MTQPAGSARAQSAPSRLAWLVLLPVLLGARLTVACAPDGAPPAAAGFYAAADVELSPGDPRARLGFAGRRSVVRRWYAPDPPRWRWEVEPMGTTLDDGTVLTVVNASDSWTYDDRSHTYRRATIGEVPDTVVLSPIFSAPLGPANVATIDAFIEAWRERGVDTPSRASGEATVLGRRTQVVELRAAADGVTPRLHRPCADVHHALDLRRKRRR